MDLQHLGSDAMSVMSIENSVVSSVDMQAKNILMATRRIENVFLLQQEIEKRISCFGDGKFAERIRARICDILSE